MADYVPTSGFWPLNPSQVSSAQTRAFNTAFQPSTSQNCAVRYAVKITTTANIGGGSEGEVYLERADDAGFTANVVALDVVSNGQSYTLAVALQGVQALTLALGADYVPPGKWLRLRTNVVAGSGGTLPTFAYISGREVLF